MNRRDEYLESMLRDLGSVYYQTLQGQASASDVARIVEAVRQHESANAAARPDADRVLGGIRQPGPAEAEGGNEPPRHDRWRVIDVMRTEVITIDKTMPYKQIVRLLAGKGLTSVPVVSGGGRVLGMVSEADVLRREERSFSRIGVGCPGAPTASVSRPRG